MDKKTLEDVNLLSIHVGKCGMTVDRPGDFTMEVKQHDFRHTWPPPQYGSVTTDVMRHDLHLYLTNPTPELLRSMAAAFNKLADELEWQSRQKG